MQEEKWDKALQNSRIAKSAARVSIILSTLFIAYIAFWFFAQGNWNHGYRDKASRVRADMRTLSTAIESYAVDHSCYPDNLNRLTTPYAYIRGIPHDPFTSKAIFYHPYYRNDKGFCMHYILWSQGTDGDQDFDPMQVEEMLKGTEGSPSGVLAEFSYSPTNGNKSDGDIFFSSQEW
jgi:hypothetical protein